MSCLYSTACKFVFYSNLAQLILFKGKDCFTAVIRCCCILINLNCVQLTPPHSACHLSLSTGFNPFLQSASPLRLVYAHVAMETLCSLVLRSRMLDTANDWKLGRILQLMPGFNHIWWWNGPLQYGLAEIDKRSAFLLLLQSILFVLVVFSFNAKRIFEERRAWGKSKWCTSQSDLLGFFSFRLDWFLV